MFTGIVEELGTVEKIERKGGGLKFSVRAQKVLDDLKVGDSIAVNGVCLTVVDVGPSSFTVEVVEETLQRSNLSSLLTSVKVNLERALSIGERLGGHLMNGHVDGVGRILSRRIQGSSIIIKVEIPRELLRYLVEKGSLALEGVSLTIMKIEGNRVSIAIIPHTAKFTTLGTKRVGEKLNVEVDLLGKYVERLLGSSESPSKAL